MEASKMILANDKKLQELEGREISVIDCISNKAVLVMGNAEERYAMINTILDSIRVDFPEDQIRDEDDPRYILRSVEHDGIWYPNYEREGVEEDSVVIEV